MVATNVGFERDISSLVETALFPPKLSVMGTIEVEKLREESGACVELDVIRTVGWIEGDSCG